MATIWEFLRGERNMPDMMGNVGKVTLTKSRPHYPITSDGPTTGTLFVNLHWTARQVAGSQGALRRKLLQPRSLRAAQTETTQGGAENVDLDLACMYELTDGTRGVVQPLGKFFGDLQHPPYIKLSGDDKYGRRPARPCTSTWRRRTSSSGC